MSRRDSNGNLVSTDRQGIGWAGGYFLLATGVVLLAGSVLLVWAGMAAHDVRPSAVLLVGSLSSISTGIWKLRDSARRNRAIGLEE